MLFSAFRSNWPLKLNDDLLLLKTIISSTNRNQLKFLQLNLLHLLHSHLQGFIPFGEHFSGDSLSIKHLIFLFSTILASSCTKILLSPLRGGFGCYPKQFRLHSCLHPPSLLGSTCAHQYVADLFVVFSILLQHQSLYRSILADRSPCSSPIFVISPTYLC